MTYAFDIELDDTLEEVCENLITDLSRALKPGGKLGIPLGDYCDRDEGYVPLAYHPKHFAFGGGLKQH